MKACRFVNNQALGDPALSAQEMQAVSTLLHCAVTTYHSTALNHVKLPQHLSFPSLLCHHFSQREYTPKSTNYTIFLCVFSFFFCFVELFCFCFAAFVCLFECFKLFTVLLLIIYVTMEWKNQEQVA